MVTCRREGHEKKQRKIHSVLILNRLHCTVTINFRDSAQCRSR